MSNLGDPKRPPSIFSSAAPVVLHVDDDPNDAELLRAAVLKSGVNYQVLTVDDGDEARSLLRQAGPLPSLILLDLKMPKSTGLEVLKWIRSQSKLSDVPVVMLSGSELQDDMEQAKAAGASGYYVKPLGFESLVQLAREIQSRWFTPKPS